jgi:hypothetical protein
MKQYKCPVCKGSGKCVFCDGSGFGLNIDKKKNIVLPGKGPCLCCYGKKRTRTKASGKCKICEGTGKIDYKLNKEELKKMREIHEISDLLKAFNEIVMKGKSR